MGKILLAPLFVLAACAAQTTSPELDATGKALTCLPKGVYLGELVNENWNDEQKATYRTAVDTWRVLNCPDPTALGYGS